MRKRYVYGIVMPEIIELGSQSFQTELAYGFVSHLPFPSFFKDLNRIVQRKFLSMLRGDKVPDAEHEEEQGVEIIEDRAGGPDHKAHNS